MRLSVRSLATLAALACASAAPCSALGAPTPTVVVPAAAPVAASRSFVQMIGDALAEVNLSADQQQMVEALGAKLSSLEARIDRADAALLHELAAQVANGMLDRNALEPTISAYVATRKDVSGPMRDVIQQLHDKLDADQRSDFADALEADIHAMRRQFTSDAKLAALAAKAGLTDLQVEQLRPNLQKFLPGLQAHHRRVHAAIEGFREDSFSLDQYFAPGDTEMHARNKANMIVDLTDAVVGVVSKDQLPGLAAAIEDIARMKESGPETIPTLL